MDRHLQQKLQQFSAMPPESAWTKIADALDAESGYAARLSQYEAEPPAHIWQTVEAALDQEEATPAKVVPFTTRFRRPMRYAAVACFIAVVLVTVTLTVKRTEAGAIQAGSETTVPTSQSVSLTKTKAAANSSSPAGATAKTNEGSKRDQYLSSEKEQNNAATVAATNDVVTQTTTSSLNHEYVVFSDGDGRLRKVSKKLASFIKCGDSDLPCKQRLQQLRQKMAASVITTDFTGLVESLRQLQ